jgi:hypothetical protein
MSTLNFIESIKNDRRFNLQIVEHKYIPPMEPRYMKLDLSLKPREVLRGRGIELFYSHQVEAINFIRQGENVVVMTPTASGKSLIYNIPALELGVGITLEDIEEKELPLPKRDMIPLSVEEQIICFADKFFSKDSDFLLKEKLLERVRTYISKFGEDNVKKFDERVELFGI